MPVELHARLKHPNIAPDPADPLDRISFLPRKRILAVKSRVTNQNRAAHHLFKLALRIRHDLLGTPREKQNRQNKRDLHSVCALVARASRRAASTFVSTFGHSTFHQD